jgi:uncharacterized protein YqjF (DUF2071 family)
MPAEPLRGAPPHGVRPALLRQAWRDVAFLHWPLDPEIALPLLPPGIEPDVLHDSTYVGVVPLRITRTALGPLPPVPYLGSFAEVNVRLYGVDPRGRRTVVMLRMDAARLLPVVAARAIPRLPYVWSRAQVHRDGGDYAATAGDRRIRLRIGERLTPGPLDVFLTARWQLHTRVAGRTVRIPVTHSPWQLHAAQLVSLDGDPLQAAGLPPAAGPPVSVLFSPGVDDVRVGPASGE